MFALSAPFWWAFEIANWRLENWRYVGEQLFTGPARMPLKTLSFLFVLPALAESRDLLRPSCGSRTRRPSLPSWTAGALVVTAWSACPCSTSSRTRRSRWSGWPPGRPGRDRRAARPAEHHRPGPPGPGRAGGAAGRGRSRHRILWELWNWGALPFWQYRIPYVGFFPVFEMPILGYLGYPVHPGRRRLLAPVHRGAGGLTEARSPTSARIRPGRPHPVTN